MEDPKTRAILAFFLVLAFGVLLFGGYLTHRDKPPIPGAVVTADGRDVYTGEDIIAGQSRFYARGGQHIGTIWGHGAYLAPDWSADYLHRLGLFLAARHLGRSPEEAARFTQEELERLAAATRGSVEATVAEEIKTNRFDPALGKLLPYAAARTWHLQLAVYFIATCFLAAGLFIGPFLGREPKHQAKLVWGLLAAVVVVVLGSLGGTYLSTTGRMGGAWYLFGHQGYEYVELGRVWQLLLIAGMLIWLVLVVRAIRPALSGEKDAGGITHLLLYSAVSIPAFYMVGLLYGKGAHLSDAEYWRWWVVHLWVEGFFALYYIQGLNTTPIHSHTALFGVYGLLAISLMLFSMRHIVTKAAWSDRLLKWSFWGLNGGLLSMALLSLVPSGFYRFCFAVRDGMWRARSPEITSGPVWRFFSWLRIGPDLIFVAGAVLLLVFVGRAIVLTVRARQP